MTEPELPENIIKWINENKESMEPKEYELSPHILKWLEEADKECPDPDCICKKEKNE